MKWLKPLKFPSDENQKMETSETNRSITRSQQTSDSKKLSSKYKRSFSQNDISMVDLTAQDEDAEEIPFKKPKMSGATRKDDIKKLLVPKSSVELVINSKKVQEVKGWFQECERLKNIRVNPILLVTGPCGSGKLTCVKVIAEESGYDVHEYVAPLDYDLNVMNAKERDWEYSTKEGQVENLIKFLRDTTRYGTIFNKAKNKKLIVCKDIPNIFSEEPQLFKKVLQ